MKNKYPKPSRVLLDAAYKNGKTYIKDVYFSPPFKIMQPFYKHDDYMTIICMSSSSGIMAGDHQEYELIARKGSKLEFTSNEYEKINKMEGGSATRTSTIMVEDDATMYYNPQPTIPFADSALESLVNVHLANESSRFIMKEVLSSGRSARGENFQYRFYHNLINVYEGNTLIYRDNSRFNPSMTDLSGMGMYEGYQRFGTLLLFHCNKDSEWIQKARTMLDEAPDIDGGVTAVPGDGVVIRALGKQSDSLDQLFDKILALS